MSSYLLRRLLLIIPTLFGIMLINFAVVQIVPGGPVEQMIAQMTGTAIESTARFSGNAEGESLENFNIEDLEELEKIGVEIATEEGIWNCIFLERICEGPNNQSIEWL